MPVTIPQVQRSSPEGLTQSGAELGRSASGLSVRIRRQRATLETLKAGWHGTASAAAIAKAMPTLEQMQRAHNAMTRLQATLHDGGGALAQTRTNIVSTAGQFRQQGWQVSPDGGVSVRPGSSLDTYAKLGPVNAMQVQQLGAANSTALKTLLASFDSADRRLGQTLRTAVTGLDGRARNFWGGAPLPQTPGDTGPKIPAGKSPEEVKRWWDSLTQAEKDQLLADQPEKLGNLNGIPVEDRSRANIAVMKRDIARVANATEAIPYHEMVRYYNALTVRDGLAAQHGKTGAPTYLYVYEPEAFDGQGRAAIAIGNPDDADNTAVVVPGTGNSVESGWLSSDDPARVYDQTSKADRTRSTAVVVWMGYNAPDSLVDPQVAQTGNARQGGALLAADINALEVTNKGDSHVAVIGHSYGSTTVADASAGYGMRADDVVLIGSPGTDMADSAADFNLPEGGHVYVGAVSTDPVTHLGGDHQAHIPGTDITVALGNDPAEDGYSSTRFKAEVPGLSWPWADHSSYLMPGSESLFSIATIASGHGDRLGDHGMTAPHRTEIPVFLPGLPSVEVDPEIWRPGTSGHTY